MDGTGHFFRQGGVGTVTMLRHRAVDGFPPAIIRPASGELVLKAKNGSMDLRDRFTRTATDLRATTQPRVAAPVK